MSIYDRLIIALDVETASKAHALVEALGDRGRFYKIGMQLFTAEGPCVVRDLVGKGKKVFLDLKLHEIPNSVAGAVKSAGELGVSMVTVHALGGSAVLRAAVEAARHHPQLQVIALTVITSLGDQDLLEIGIAGTVQDQVLRLAHLADQAGCHGVIASPQEAAVLKNILRHEMAIVTPGVRLAGEVTNDQKRVATPSEAICAGATHLVIGRSITGASDPAGAFDRIAAEISQVFHGIAASSVSPVTANSAKDSP